MSFIKVVKDLKRIKSILDMTEMIEKRIKRDRKKNFYPLILSDYYEIIKELITAILLCDGFKTVSHVELVQYLKENYKGFSDKEILIIDRLRILRNRVSYEGLKIPLDYLIDNESSFLGIIKKLRLLIIMKIKRF